MKVGITTYDITAKDLVDLAVAADELGFESLWLGEHIVLPLDYETEHPTTNYDDHHHHTGPIIDPSTILVDPLVALSAAAAATQHIKLATGVYILPLRPPLITARMTCTLHDVSDGRFLLGVGSGWLEEEYNSVGVPFAERRGRYEESIEILRLSWAGKPFRFDGKYFHTGLVQMSEEPVNAPLILGGNTEPALRRAALKADGWFASGTPTFEACVRLRERLLQLRSENSRSGDFPMWVRVPRGDTEDFSRYEAEGLDRVLIWSDQLWPADADLDTKRAALAQAADRFGVTPGGSNAH